MTGEVNADSALSDEIIGLYALEPDLRQLPAILFAAVARVIDSDAISYTEVHPPTSAFRSLLSIGDDPRRRGDGIFAFARHMRSHPFRSHNPTFYGERALRESDYFSESDYLALPIARDVFLPSGVRHIMAIVIAQGGHALSLVLHRVLGRPPFSDAERDRLQSLRPHVSRCYRQAQERLLARLTPLDRLHMAFPDLTRRQLEVAWWLAQGRTNPEIATILSVGIDTIKAHVKALYRKTGSESRLEAAVIAHTVAPFGESPPLWTLEPDAWGHDDVHRPGCPDTRPAGARAGHGSIIAGSSRRFVPKPGDRSSAKTKR